MLSFKEPLAVREPAELRAFRGSLGTLFPVYKDSFSHLFNSLNQKPNETKQNQNAKTNERQY